MLYELNKLTKCGGGGMRPDVTALPGASRLPREPPPIGAPSPLKGESLPSGGEKVGNIFLAFAHAPSSLLLVPFEEENDEPHADRL